MSKKSPKVRHIGLVPPGSGVGVPTKRLCGGKPTKSRGWHWDGPVCGPCVTAAIRTTDHRTPVIPIWVTFTTNATASGSATWWVS